MRTILVDHFLGSSISSRALARDLDLLIRNSGEQEIILDFSGVIFANRSFMDEFNTIFYKGSYPVKIDVVGLSPDLQTLLDAVKKTRKSTKPRTKKVKPVLLGNYRAVSDFMKTLPV